MPSYNIEEHCDILISSCPLKDNMVECTEKYVKGGFAWQILEEVLKSEAAEKKAHEGATGKLETKAIPTLLRRRAALKCSSMTFKAVSY